MGQSSSVSHSVAQSVTTSSGDPVSMRFKDKYFTNIAQFLLDQPFTQQVYALWKERGIPLTVEKSSLEPAPDLTQLRGLIVTTERYYAADIIGHPQEMLLLYLREWVFALQEKPESLLMAGYRLILALFSENIQYIDLRALNITEGDPTKKTALDIFLNWLVIYPSLQWIDLHPDDGELPAAVQAVLSEHRFLHRTMLGELTATYSWEKLLALLPTIADIYHQSQLAAYWLLDYLALEMLDRPSLVDLVKWTGISDVNLQIVVSHRPKCFERCNELVATADIAEWLHFYHTIEHHFEHLNGAWQQKIEQILAKNTAPAISRWPSIYLSLSNKKIPTEKRTPTEDWHEYRHLYINYHDLSYGIRHTYTLQFLAAPPHELKKGWIYLYLSSNGSAQYSFLALDGEEIINKALETELPVTSMQPGELIQDTALCAAILREAARYGLYVYPSKDLNEALAALRQRASALDDELASIDKSSRHRTINGC